MSGHLQQMHGYGFGQACTVAASGLSITTSLSHPVWFKLYAADAGANTDIALVGYTDGGFNSQAYYGRSAAKLPITVNMKVDTTTDPLSSYPPSFTADNGSATVFTVTIAAATEGAPGLYYLEWWSNMLWTFAQKVKDELEGGVWSTAPDDWLLLADDDPDRLNSRVKSALKDRLVVLHSISELEAGEGFDGGFGRNGRALSCLISVYAKSRAGMDANDEETPLATVSTLLEEVRTELWPSGVPNLLSAYIYYGKLEVDEPPATAPELGGGVYKATLRYTGYKMEV